ADDDPDPAAEARRPPGGADGDRRGLPDGMRGPVTGTLLRRLRPRRPAPTIRLRLTILYGLVFLLTGAVLLTIGYALVRHNVDAARLRDRYHLVQPGTRLHIVPFPFAPTPAARAYFRDLHRQLVSDALDELLVEYLIALGVMTLVSVAAG